MQKNSLIAFKINPHDKKLNCLQIENNLRGLQSLVGGKIELALRVGPPSEVYAKESGIISFDLFVNEEALLGKPQSFFFIKTPQGEEYGPFAGDGFIVGASADGDALDTDPLIMTQFKFILINQNDPEFLDVVKMFPEHLSPEDYE